MWIMAAIKKKRGRRVLVTSDGRELKITSAKKVSPKERREMLRRASSGIRLPSQIDTARFRRDRF